MSGISANSAASISCRGCARVMSQTEIATVWPAPDHLAKRRPAERRADRRGQRGVRIRNRRPEHRFDDRDALLREIHLEPVDAVVQTHAHGGITLSGTCQVGRGTLRSRVAGNAIGRKGSVDSRSRRSGVAFPIREDQRRRYLVRLLTRAFERQPFSGVLSVRRCQRMRGSRSPIQRGQRR